MHEQLQGLYDNEPHPDCFILRPDSLPPHLHPLLEVLDFRRCSIDEVRATAPLTRETWPGITETPPQDLIANFLLNAPTCGAFTKKGELVAYTRLLWGYTPDGIPKMHSHMTAVSGGWRDKGVGEALKWQARQIAQEFPNPAVEVLSVTFDNLQGGVCHVNLNKLGMVVEGTKGFRHDLYGDSPSKQHLGNPTDRYYAVWHLNSKWVQAHLEGRVIPFDVEQARIMPLAIEIADLSVHTELSAPYLTMPIPMNLNQLLETDQAHEYRKVIAWRTAARIALENYLVKGYAVIGQVTDKARGVNLQILAQGFSPHQPPHELMR